MPRMKVMILALILGALLLLGVYADVVLQDAELGEIVFHEMKVVTHEDGNVDLVPVMSSSIDDVIQGRRRLQTNRVLAKATASPTKKPTKAPTMVPTRKPTKAPTEMPTKAPTRMPTRSPTKLPTKMPTSQPTKAPTKAPTMNPTKLQTKVPTKMPTKVPTKVPTKPVTTSPTKLSETSRDTMIPVASTGKKFLKLVLVFDSLAVSQLGGTNRVQARAQSIGSRIKRILAKLPPLVTQVVEVRFWTADEEIAALGSNAARNDNSFLVAVNDWRAKSILVEHAVGHLFTGRSLFNTVDDRTIFAKRSACNPTMSSTLSSIYQQTSDDLIAKYAVHSIAHAIGLEHLTVFTKDAITLDDAQACVKVTTEVMQSGRLIDQSPSAISWSLCSRKWMDIFFNGFPAGCSGSACIIPAAYVNRFDVSTCMERPSTNDLFPVCGDGILQQGEECDCGDPSTCTDKCCNPSTCKLVQGASCSALDACCDASTCKPYHAEQRKVCRPALSSCDLAETCNGASKYCPVDAVMSLGTSCITAKGLVGGCGQGICQNQEEQCQARSGLANKRSCAVKAANACRKLGCKNANAKTCTALAVKVNDGTPCGSNKFCYNGQCLSVSKLPNGR